MICKKVVAVCSLVLCAALLHGCVTSYSYDGKNYSNPQEVYNRMRLDVQEAIPMLPDAPRQTYGKAVVAINSRSAIEERALIIQGAVNRSVIDYLVSVTAQEEEGIVDLIRKSDMFDSVRRVKSDWPEDARMRNADYLIYHHIPSPGSHQWYITAKDWDKPKPISLDMGRPGVSAKLASLVENMSGILAEQTPAPVKAAASPAPMPTPYRSEPALSGAGQRYAVVIGLSRYGDSRIPALRYGEKDAKALYSWLTSPQGGYAPANVKLLTGKDATARNIRTALFSWLKQALEEDTVLIYFAGHGSPDSPDSPENLYLLPYDTDYTNIAATAFPMWDVQTALKRFVKAKRAIVIADACHSGGVGETFAIARRAVRGLKVNPISNSLQKLSNLAEGICVISASDANQMSQESHKWGGGHGVFTYHLLEGLKGGADYDRNNVVSLGELIPFLSQSVRRATSNAQSPTVSGQFDPSITIAQ